MTDWRSVAYVHPCLHFSAGSHGLGGTTLEEPIPAGAEILALPYPFIITASVAEERLLRVAPAVKELRTSQPEVVTGRVLIYLYMLIAFEDDQGHGPYLRSLPSSHDDPLSWNEDELRELEGTNLESAIAERRSTLQRAYDALFPALFERCPGAFPRSTFMWERFLWAHASFTSRAFPHWLGVPPRCATANANATATAASAGDGAAAVPDDDPTGAVGCLLPVLDTLNHGYRVRMSWIRHADRLAFVTEDAIPPFSPVLNTYGPKSNEEFLAGYGFVLPGNPHDTAAVRFGVPAASPAPCDESGDSTAADAAAMTADLLSWAGFSARHVLRRSAGSVRRLDEECRRASAPAASSATFPIDAFASHDSDARGSLPPEFLPFLRVLTLPPSALAFLWDVARRWPCTVPVPATPEGTGVDDQRPAQDTPLAVSRAALIRACIASPVGVDEEGRALSAGIQALSSKLSRLQTGRPWLAAQPHSSTDVLAATGCSSRRVAMAREYVRGQWAVMADALRELAAGAEVAATVTADTPAAAEIDVTALCVTSLAAVAPELAEALNGVEGLQVDPASDGDAEDEDSEDAGLAKERIQLALLLVNQTLAHAVSPWMPFIEWAAEHYGDAVLGRSEAALLDAAARISSSGGSFAVTAGGRLSACRAVVQATAAALQRTAARIRTSLGDPDSAEEYADLFPVLSRAAPRALPLRKCTLAVWRWATRVVDSEACSASASVLGAAGGRHRAHLVIPRAATTCAPGPPSAAARAGEQHAPGKRRRTGPSPAHEEPAAERGPPSISSGCVSLLQAASAAAAAAASAAGSDGADSDATAALLSAVSALLRALAAVEAPAVLLAGPSVSGAQELTQRQRASDAAASLLRLGLTGSGSAAPFGAALYGVAGGGEGVGGS